MQYSTQVSTDFYGLGAEAPAVSLALEQEPYPTDSGGVLTPVEIAEANGLSIRPTVTWDYVSSDVEEIYELYYAQCSANADGSITATINVYTVPEDLKYNLVTNSGVFGDKITGTVSREKSVTFELNHVVDLGCTPSSIESIEWDGNIYNSGGGIIHPSTPTLSGSQLVMDELVYGVCKIQYTISCDVYELRVPKRDDDTYQATVFAFFGDGQVEKLEVRFPNLTGMCTAGYSVSFDTGDEEEPPDCDEGDGASATIQLVAYDECTGKEISGATFYINSKQVPATGHTVKRGVSYSLTVKASSYKDKNTSFSV